MASVRMYADYDTLILAALAKNPGCSLSHDCLAAAFLAKGQLDEAIAHYQKSLAVEPDDADSHSNLADAFLRSGRPDAAIVHLQEALKLRPGDPGPQRNLAIALSRKRQIELHRAVLPIPDANPTNALLPESKP